MSLTRAVPLAVPSLFHSSLRSNPPATKNRVPLTLVSPVGYELPPLCPMSLTSAAFVPAEACAAPIASSDTPASAARRGRPRAPLRIQHLPCNSERPAYRAAHRSVRL